MTDCSRFQLISIHATAEVYASVHKVFMISGVLTTPLFAKKCSSPYINANAFPN